MPFMLFSVSTLVPPGLLGTFRLEDVFWLILLPGATFLLLVFCWLDGDVRLPTKVVLSILALLGTAVTVSAECGMLGATMLMIIDGLVWWVTFGPSLPSRRV